MLDSVWVGSVLRHARTVARVSIADAATAAGVSIGTISNWETGRVLPRPEQVLPLATLYGIPQETLLYELGYPTGNVTPLREWYLNQPPRPRRPWRARAPLPARAPNTFATTPTNTFRPREATPPPTATDESVTPGYWAA
jgi:transcriptional regulator with XRE-family HTH domain